MNRQQFKNYLKTPERLTAKDAEQMGEVLKKFPYFQTAHLLYVKALHNDNNIQYNAQLKQAAAYSGNRTVLYQLIKKAVETTEENVHQKNNFSTLNLTTPKNEENIVANLAQHEEIKSESEITLHAEQFEGQKNNFSDELDQEILKEAVSASFEINLIDAEEKIISADKNISKNVAEEKDETFVSEKHSFTDWLSWTDKNNLPISEKKSDKITEDLIAKFIEEEPKIKPKTAFYSPVNMARQSVMENFLVTETLANIYEQQGNYAKAIDAFQKLKIKHPQKNNFFNDKIRALKKLLNKK